MKALQLLTVVVIVCTINGRFSIARAEEALNCGQRIDSTIFPGRTARCPSTPELAETLNNLTSTIATTLMSSQSCLPLPGTRQTKPANSCQAIYSRNRQMQSGLYWILNSTGSAVNGYCRFDKFTNFSFFNANITNGFLRVGILNMSDASNSCPSTLMAQTSTGYRLCQRKTTAGGSCSSVLFSSYGVSWQTVCGRVTGYEFYSPSAFNVGSPSSADQIYVEGVSITYGSPRKHLWTYAVGLFESSSTLLAHICPCAGGKSPPTFVNNDYYCESGNPGSVYASTVYTGDVLWDGMLCRGSETTCCDPPQQPWFCKKVPTPTTDSIEMRLCADQVPSDEDASIVQYEFLVQ